MKIHSFDKILLQKKPTESDEAKIFTFVNPYSYYLVDKLDNKNNFDSIFIDGITLVWAYNLLHKNKVERTSFDFTSIAHDVLLWAEKNNIKTSFIGGNSDEIEKAISVIKKKYPSINIPYYRNGYFNNHSDILDCLDLLKKNEIELLICGMGTPIQENFLIESKNTLSSLKLGFTCGGFISQIATNENYYNPTLNKLNLRWLQRFMRHSHVRKRIFINYPIFFFKYFFNNLLNK
ncbi:WecB/TagA/CpsF family glycosyltransferase [Moellerella wisconsensis]|uniref:WecB/TagA/CpsF family glycosyltransferase n=1 Tax=Moellerella wisconsensis TaxID=158849 RepID=UPI0030762041